MAPGFGRNQIEIRSPLITGSRRVYPSVSNTVVIVSGNLEPRPKAAAPVCRTRIAMRGWHILNSVLTPELLI